MLCFAGVSRYPGPLMLRKIERERAGLSAALLGMGTTAHQALVDTPAKHRSQPQVSMHTNKRASMEDIVLD